MQTEEVDTVTATLEHVEQEPDQLTPPPYSRKLLFGGIVGRIWLWFVAGCLAVTLIPMLFGWRPYVIQSGSMQPRIKVGDIVIASPNHDPKHAARSRHRVPGPGLPEHGSRPTA